MESLLPVTVVLVVCVAVLVLLGIAFVRVWRGAITRNDALSEDTEPPHAVHSDEPRPDPRD